jgi:type I restriction enzyme S subunit
MSLSLDKATWKRVHFGDVAKNVNLSVKDPKVSGIERIIAMDHLDPGELKVSRWGSIGDGTTFTRRVKPGQTLFGKRRAYQRKAAYAEFDAITSGDILVFEADGIRLLPEFLPFLVRSDGFYEHALGTSAGSLSPRTNWRDLASYEFDLPDLNEQKRLADLLWAIERHHTELKKRLGSVFSLLRHFLGRRFAELEGESVAIVDLCEDVVGGIWGSPEGESEVDVLALGPKIYSLGTTEFVTDGSPVRSISQRQADTRIVRENDIILERSGGSPDQPVGRVVIAGAGLAPCIPTDFQRLLRPNPALVEPRFLYWRLRHDWLQGVTRNYSRRTTNITNLSVKDYIARELIVPTLKEQRRILGEVGAFEGARMALTADRESLANLRSSILADIFGGVDGSVR